MLTDRFNRVQDYLRISLTQACNLRCGYCVPSDNPGCFTGKQQEMTAEEITILVEKFSGLGIKKIRFTGGEPLMRKDFGRILPLLKFEDERPELALTTNGVLIHRFIEELKNAEFQSVNVSLDSLMPERFEKITRRNLFHQVYSNIHLLLQHDFRVKLNVVVMKNVNDDELPDFVRLTRDYPFEIRFIEFMPFLGNGWGKEKFVPYAEMKRRISLHFDAGGLPAEANDTSINFKVPGFAGSFGFIPAMSAPFCEGCSRLRLTADGKLKNCLFSKEETDLLTILRTGGNVEEAIRESVLHKKEKWGGRQLFEQGAHRSMISIGG